MNPVYLWDVMILLMAAVIAVPFFQSIRLGAVPGFLISGIIVGPFGLGLISSTQEIAYLSEFGVVLLLFVIGIELKPSRLWLMRRFVFGLGSLQVVLTGIVIGWIGYAFFGLDLKAALLVGPALALSSTAFVLQLLTEQKSLSSHYGRASFATLLFQDLAVVPLLALVPLLSSSTKTVGEDITLALFESLAIVILVVVAGRYLLHPLLHRVAKAHNDELFSASAIVIVLGSALATEHAGLSMAMGAFLAGLMISDSSYKHQVMAEIHPFRGLLLGLFFMSMGMSLNIGLFLGNPLVAIGMLLLLLSVKTILLFALSMLFKLGKKNSLAIALMLAQSGEFALVLFSLAHERALLSEAVFQDLLLMVLFSMIVTPALAQMAHRLVYKESDEQSAAKFDSATSEHIPVVIAGFGRVGQSIADLLDRAGRKYVAFEAKAQRVENTRAKGYNVYYGDVRNIKLIEASGAKDAKTVIVTLDDPDATRSVVTALRHALPDVSILVRGHNVDECRTLLSEGATITVSEILENSLELARRALLESGMSTEASEALITQYRSSYYERLQ